MRYSGTDSPILSPKGMYILKIKGYSMKFIVK